MEMSNGDDNNFFPNYLINYTVFETMGSTAASTLAEARPCVGELFDPKRCRSNLLEKLLA
jgi:hypothetical protein